MDERTPFTMSELVKRVGYDQENEYFYHRNRELLERLRQELDERRKERDRLERQKAHWMKCPKCGGDMQELEVVSNVKGDLCTWCHGVFFDHIELEMLERASSPRRLKDTLKQLIAAAIKPRPTGLYNIPV